jgi:hypothetical protein
MKQARRKELQTNELSVYLHQISDAIQRHANYLLGGLVVVALVLAVALYVRQSRHAAIETARSQYYEVQRGDVAAQPELLELARQLAASYGDHSELGPDVLQAAGDAAYDRAMSLTAPQDQAQRRELLQEARGRYEEKIRRFSNRRDAVAEARMSLAAVEEETLLATGEGSREAIETHYQQVIDAPTNPYQGLARLRLEDLNERLKPLEIVATRPAEEPPPAPAMPQIQFEPLPPAEEPAPPTEEHAPADEPAATQEPAPAEEPILEPAPAEPAAPAEAPPAEEPVPAEEPAAAEQQPAPNP